MGWGKVLMDARWMVVVLRRDEFGRGLFG
jgi:hypothetical protein